MTAWAEIEAARARAHAKHGANSIEAMDSTDPRWLSVLVEEVGEVAHALTYDATDADLRAELVDVLSVASAWLDAADRDVRRVCFEGCALTPGHPGGCVLTDRVGPGHAACCPLTCTGCWCTSLGACWHHR